MAVISNKSKLVYFPIPKIACSSIKSMFFELEYGLSKKEFRTKRPSFMLHQHWPSVAFEVSKRDVKEGFQKIVVIRQPKKRFFSGFNEKVLIKKEGNFINKCNELNLNTNPNINEFILNFERYCKIPIIYSHFRPMSFFLGEDLNYFDLIFSLENIKEFEEFMSERIQQKIIIPKINSHKKKFKSNEISNEAKNMLEKILHQDNILFQQYLSIS